MMTILDPKMHLDMVLICNMLEAVKIPVSIVCYIQSFYSALSVIIITNKNWETKAMSFQRGAKATP